MTLINLVCALVGGGVVYDLLMRFASHQKYLGIGGCSLNDVGLTAPPVPATPVKVTAYRSYLTVSGIKPIVTQNSYCDLSVVESCGGRRS